MTQHTPLFFYQQWYSRFHKPIFFSPPSFTLDWFSLIANPPNLSIDPFIPINIVRSVINQGTAGGKRGKRKGRSDATGSSSSKKLKRHAKPGGGKWPEKSLDYLREPFSIEATPKNISMGTLVLDQGEIESDYGVLNFEEVVDDPNSVGYPVMNNPTSPPNSLTDNISNNKGSEA
ncbi:hypothetical protein BVC80_8493g3 [Macleaya cordata]|uniref:Uncharacterized protein n=1 Tax=Macleaya cordata TaxID=56857 RepID=A0A200QXY5_MACCD|nr:hypothetical protein BVC80_8493g3 [Macleaya cordata]